MIRAVLEPYLVWIRLAAVILAALVIAFGVVTVKKWHRDSLALASVKAEAAAQVEQARQVVQQMKAAQAAAYAASKGYQDELEAIRNRPVPRQPVRLCVPAGAVPGAAAVAARPGTAVPAADVVSGTDGTDPAVRAGPDIGPALSSLAKWADGVSAQGRAIQSLAPPSAQP